LELVLTMFMIRPNNTTFVIYFTFVQKEKFCAL